MDFNIVQKIITAVLIVTELFTGSDNNKSNSKKDNDWF